MKRSMKKEDSQEGPGKGSCHHQNLEPDEGAKKDDPNRIHPLGISPRNACGGL